jgi:hypothetical protein
MLSAEWVDAAEAAEVFAPPVAAGFTPLDPAVFALLALLDFALRLVDFAPHLLDSGRRLVDFAPRLVDSGQVSQVDLDQADPGFAHSRPRPGAMACRHLLRLGIPSHADHLCRDMVVSTMGFTTSITTTDSSTIVLDFHAARLSSSEAVLASVLEPVRFLDGPSSDRPSMDLLTIRITPATIMGMATRHPRSQLS